MTMTQSAASGLRQSETVVGAGTAVVTIGVLLAAGLVWWPAKLAAGLAGISTYALISAIVLLRVTAFHPFANFGAANWVTLARGALVGLMLALLSAAPVAGDITLFALAMLILGLDGFDGWLARRSGMQSRFGARFDMEIDALLILVLSLAAFLGDKAGIWVLSLGLMRYAFVAAGLLMPALTRDLPASLRRKYVCVAQIIVLSALTLPQVGAPYASILAVIALLALAWSFATDIRWLLGQEPRA